MSTYIYVISDGDSWRCKIGVAQDPEKRLRQLQTGNASRLHLVHASACKSRKVAEVGESLCHEFLSDSNIRGEWFTVNPELASLLVTSSVMMPGSMRSYLKGRGQ